MSNKTHTRDNLVNTPVSQASLSADEYSRLPMRKALGSTLMFLLFLLVSANVFFSQARAQGLTLGGDEAPADTSKPTLDLGPAPNAPAGSSGAGGVAQAPNLADLVRTKQGDWDVACEKSGQ